MLTSVDFKMPEASAVALTADAVKMKILQDVKPKRGPEGSNIDGALSEAISRTCFNCQKSGHYAPICPEKNAPIKQVEEALQYICDW